MGSDRDLMSAQLGGLVRSEFGQVFGERSARRICPKYLRTHLEPNTFSDRDDVYRFI